MSGGGTITITRPKVRVMLQTEHKTPMPGHEKAWNESVQEWETETKASAEHLATEIEKALPAPNGGIEFLSGEFDPQLQNPTVSSEGAVDRRSESTGPHFLLKLHPVKGRQVCGGYVTVSLVMKVLPNPEVIRKFSLSVENVVRKEGGVEIENQFEPYGLYKLEFESGLTKSAFLLSKVSLSQLKQSIAATAYSDIGYETFRRSKALLIDLDERGAMKKNSAGYYIGNPTAAKINEPYEYVTLQVNGAMRPRAKLRRATRDEVLKALEKPVPDSRKDLEFLRTIEDQFSG